MLLCLQLSVYLEKDNAIVGEDNENIKCLKFSVSHYFDFFFFFPIQIGFSLENYGDIG